MRKEKPIAQGKRKMTERKALCGQKGTVLIVVAGLLAALALLGVAFVIVVSSRASQTRDFLNLEKARQAAMAGIEYALASSKVISESLGNELNNISASNLAAALVIANSLIFRAQKPESFYFLGNGNFPHDAYDVTPDSNSPLGVYVDDLSGVEDTLDSVGALYSCAASDFEIDGLSEPPIPPGGGRWELSGESIKEITLFGWGRVFSKITDASGDKFIPLCDEGCMAELKLRLTGWVSLPDPAKPDEKIYEFNVEVKSITKRERVLIDANWKNHWQTSSSKPWFLP